MTDSTTSSLSSPASSGGMAASAVPVPHNGLDAITTAAEGFRYLFDGIADALFIHDLKGRFLEVNAAACRHLGYTREELLAMTVAELDAPVINAKADANWAAFLAVGEMVIESVHQRKDGAQVPVELNVRLIEHEGQRWVLTVARDISERKRVEEELRQLNAQVKHLATIAERERLSRELHDGLAQVLGCLSLKAEAVQLALAGGDTVQAGRRVDEIIELAQCSYAEVREAILDLRTPVTQGAGLKSVLDEYLVRFKRDWAIETSLAIPADELTHLSPAVEVQLLRIVQEAMTNVRRHAGASRVSVRFAAAGANQVRVTVEDDGRGFDPDEIRARCFGLHTMRERAEGAGGTFVILSRPGGGTTVAVTVPCGM